MQHELSQSSSEDERLKRSGVEGGPSKRKPTQNARVSQFREQDDAKAKDSERGKEEGNGAHALEVLILRNQIRNLSDQRTRVDQLSVNFVRQGDHFNAQRNEIRTNGGVSRGTEG